jgi:hypothetical protein
MSALGQKRTFAAQNGMSALPPIADIGSAQVHVRFGPKADIWFSRASENSSAHSPSPRTEISLHRRCASEHPLRPQPLAVLAVEAPLPPDPHLVVSGELCVHLEIRAHRGA